MPPRSIVLAALLFLLPNQSRASEPAAEDLKRLSIEQLMQIAVTVAGRVR